MRQFTLADLEDLYSIRSDPEVVKFITGLPATKEQFAATLEKHLQRWEQYGFGPWALNFQGGADLLGWCGLDFLDTTTEVEVGYGLARRFWRLGIASEAAAASLRYGFQSLNLKRIVAVAYPQNTASWHIMEKLGMRYVKKGWYYGAEMVYYEIGCDEFRPSASKYVLRDNPSRPSSK
jgi:ribosomal-protein-alanine N-acetyltransferase